MSYNFDMDIFLSEISEKFKISKSDIWKRQFKELSDWLFSLDYNVTLKKGCQQEVDREENIIYINSNLKWENRYYSLLHEAGHVLVDNNKDKFSYNYPFYIDEDKVGRRGNKYKISTIGEEMEAWIEGRKLGDFQLNHFINYDKYDKLMSDCVMTYVYWASES
tara:strand:+ start:326 stop:814 length:489 start_codon:yes stop_codon:yes gene_type:complete